MKRTDYCGRIDEKRVGQEVTVMGWVHRVRDMGGLTFLDLRDREGLLQIVFLSTFQGLAEVKALKSESVVSVHGTVVSRETPNPELKTGTVEVQADSFQVLSPVENLPFYPADKLESSEETRLKNRFLDLRKERLQNNIALRHRTTFRIRRFLDSQGFYEIETPILIKSTPEGARDFLVPSRLRKGTFYALPQSPQLFKQILMISGFDRYFQVARCFRDEDLRADRQPEFTQVDIEMSFVEEDDVMTLAEGVVREAFQEIGVEVPQTLERMPYDEAMRLYASDKPDLRYPETIVDFSDILQASSSPLAKAVAEEGGLFRGILFSQGERFSRKVLDSLNDEAKRAGTKGVFLIRYQDGEIKSSLKLESGELKALAERASLKEGSALLLCAGLLKPLLPLLDQLRRRFGTLVPGYRFLWVTDFPLFERDEEGNLAALHHAFTHPRLPKGMDLLEADPLTLKAKAYDMVLNGNEIGGGSVRIHDPRMQEKVFRLLNLTPEQAEEKFGFFLRALRAGTPPHGGIAFGLDRLIMLMAGENSIREVMPFPKTTSGLCLMSETPSTVDEAQLEELGIRVATEKAPS